MKCSYCNHPANFKCSCKQPYMCEAHLGAHCALLRNHPFENLDIEIEFPRLNLIKSALLNRLQTILNAKSEILLMSKLLIKEIERLSQIAVGKFDILINHYEGLLMQKKFCESEMKEIENIELYEIDIKKLNIDDIKCEIGKLFTQNLVNYMERSEYTKIQFLNRHAAGFRCGTIIDEFKTLVTGGFDSTIRVWDLINKNQKFVLYGHNSTVYCLASTRDSKFIISGSTDASVRVWNLEQRMQAAIHKEHKSIIYSICYEEEKLLIISGDVSGVIIFWSFTTQTIFKRVECQSAIFSMLLLTNSMSLIAGQGKKIVFYNIETGNVNKTLEGHKRAIWSIKN